MDKSNLVRTLGMACGSTLLGVKQFYRLLPRVAWILIITMIIGCSVDEQDILKYGRQGDTWKLAKYIEKNIHNPKHSGRIKLAATQMFMWDDLFVWENIRELFYSDFDSALARHSLLVQGQALNANLLQRTVTLQMRSERKTDHEDALALTNKAIQVGIEPADSLWAIKSAIEKFLDLGRISDSLLTEKRQLEHQYKFLQGKVEELEGWLKQNTPIQLYGSIRAQKEEGVYEITVNQEPAILITTDTRFETTGYFQVWANEVADNMPVTLRQEYGGFTQKWKLYREVPAIELDTRFKLANEKRIELEQTFSEMWSLQGKPEAINRKIEKIRVQRGTLKERAESIYFIEVS